MISPGVYLYWLVIHAKKCFEIFSSFFQILFIEKFHGVKFSSIDTGRVYWSCNYNCFVFTLIFQIRQTFVFPSTSSLNIQPSIIIMILLSGNYFFIIIIMGILLTFPNHCTEYLHTQLALFCIFAKLNILFVHLAKWIH